ncbi:hypothetical protein BHE74_00055255 [Ensete ventricosum]|nr:hypothetical protein BHE74_00055255 [Ensete ventricosum]
MARPLVWAADHLQGGGWLRPRSPARGLSAVAFAAHKSDRPRPGPYKGDRKWPRLPRQQTAGGSPWARSVVTSPQRRQSLAGTITCSAVPAGCPQGATAIRGGGTGRKDGRPLVGLLLVGKGRRCQRRGIGSSTMRVRVEGRASFYVKDNTVL